MKRLILAFVLVASPALAQPDVVASVKADLVARGVSLVDSCGAFAITSRVAWRLRATGAGLLDKPSGNQCQGRAVDIIAFPDGRIVDILTDAGGQNGPTWGPGEPVEASRWRPAVDPGDSGPVQPPVVVPPYQPPPVYTDLGPVYQRLDALSAQAERIYADLAARDAARAVQINGVDQRLKDHDEKVSGITAFFSNRLVQMLLTGAGTAGTLILAK